MNDHQISWENIKDFIDYHKDKSYSVKKGWYSNTTTFIIGNPNPQGKETYIKIIEKYFQHLSTKYKLKTNNLEIKYGFNLTPVNVSIFTNNQPSSTTLH